MDTITSFKVPLLVIAIASGTCFAISGGLDLMHSKNKAISAAYLIGGAALAAVAVALLNGWRPLATVTEYGPADPAAPMIRELMDEIRDMETSS